MQYRIKSKSTLYVSVESKVQNNSGRGLDSVDGWCDDGDGDGDDRNKWVRLSGRGLVIYSIKLSCA